MARGRVAPNAIHGVRTGRTLAGARAWREADAYSGRQRIRPGPTIAAMSAVLYAPPGADDPPNVIACGAVSIGGAIGLAWMAQSHIRRISEAGAGG